MELATSTLHLKGCTFAELFTSAGLQKLDQQFLNWLVMHAPALENQLLTYRQQDASAETPLQTSELLLALAPHLENFLAELFQIADEVAILQARTLIDDPVLAFKKYYVLREAKRHLRQAKEQEWVFAELDQWLQQQLQSFSQSQQSQATNSSSSVTIQTLSQWQDEEWQVANLGIFWLSNPEYYQNCIERLIQWCVMALLTTQGQEKVRHWVSFKQPRRLDYAELVPGLRVCTELGHETYQGDPALRRLRDGFQLTDQRMSTREVMDQVHYCVYCHEHEGDFCSKGFPVKKTEPNLGLKTNPLGEVLTGCPLEEKISEMHVLKKAGHSIASLAMIMVDNPLCPLTGHRICNDCMKACIYQKQEPVNIPQIETHILTDVLHLPWGVEIYDLLTRWNPLRKQQWLMQPYNGYKVLVMGMGPAGITLAHHLLMEGCAVVGADGLKIEPLPASWITHPVFRYADLLEPLDSRVMLGVGGVAEYGITVRWDKNFLKLVYLMLMRRPYFQIFGNIRFGGTLTVEEAWHLGFDHLAVAVGAGLPRELRIPHSLAPGMRQANDFLMALQLTGAAKDSSLANLQVRLPAVVIGGGLTGIDSATEVQAYYIKQVEKIWQRYQLLVAAWGESDVRAEIAADDQALLDEFLRHGELVVAERERAQQLGIEPDFLTLLQRWGGATIVYRRRLQDSPAYISNYEEVIKAFEEGIYYAEKLQPTRVEVDETGWVSHLVCQYNQLNSDGQWQMTEDELRIPARTILVATGAVPNVAYAFEHKGTFERKGMQYQTYQEDKGQLIETPVGAHCKVPTVAAFTSYDQDQHRVSFLGDTHPLFHGSVVKAIASAKRIYPKIMQVLLKHNQAVSNAAQSKSAMQLRDSYKNFSQHLQKQFGAQLIAKRALHPTVMELVIRAPQVAQQWQPGQFCRLQTYETTAAKIHDTVLQAEGLAMLAMRDETQADCLKFWVMQEGVSGQLLTNLMPGASVALMGPTGNRLSVAETPERILILGGKMAAIYARALGPVLREAGHHVLLIAEFSDHAALFAEQEIAESVDHVIWAIANVQQGLPLPSCGKVHVGSALDALQKWGQEHGSHPANLFSLAQIDKIIAVGGSELLESIEKARANWLNDALPAHTHFQAAVHGPMQCMLKGVCAQCLQWQKNPKTGERTKAVYACSWHMQPMQLIDYPNLDERLSQNRLQETLSRLWLRYINSN